MTTFTEAWRTGAGRAHVERKPRKPIAAPVVEKLAFVLAVLAPFSLPALGLGFLVWAAFYVAFPLGLVGCAVTCFALRWLYERMAA